MVEMDQDSFTALVRDFIVREVAGNADGIRIEVTTDLFDGAYITSLKFLKLILYLEEHLSITISLKSLNKGNFRTIRGMYETLLGTK